MEQQLTPVELACPLAVSTLMRSSFAEATAAGTLVDLGVGKVFLPLKEVLESEVSGGDNPKIVTCVAKAPNVAFAKTDAIVFTAFAAVYWDDTAKTVTDVATDNTLIGYTNRAAAANDDTAYVDFDGTLAIA